VAEVCHRWLDANPHLASVGEDRQQGGRSGVKVNRLDSVHLQDHQEEGREGRYNSSKDGEEEEGMRRRWKGVPQRPVVLDASGSPLAVLTPYHLADGLELAVALDAVVGQRRRWRRRYPRRSSCSGGPAGCHFAAGQKQISERD
jgi:hypothetical protein